MHIVISITTKTKCIFLIFKPQKPHAYLNFGPNILSHDMNQKCQPRKYRFHSLARIQVQLLGSKGTQYNIKNKKNNNKKKHTNKLLLQSRVCTFPIPQQK